MSKMKSTLAATLLTLVFAFPSMGGNIGSPGGTPPPPPPPTTTIEGGTNGLPGSPVPAGGVPVGQNPAGVSAPTLVDILMAVLSLL